MTESRSELVDALLAEVGTPSAWQQRASVKPCQGAKFHSPVPLTTARYANSPREVWLCPTCTSKLTVFIHLHETDPALLSWDVMREFGNQIRLLGQEIVRTRNEAAGRE